MVDILDAKKEKPEPDRAAIESFVDQLFEGQEGFTYAPYKSPTGAWKTRFFEWPEKRTELVTYLENYSKFNDVYLAPSLFSTADAKQENWKGSNYVWTEFDGNATEDKPGNIPLPSIRLQSSEPGHEHWYWRLDEFATDSRILSDRTWKLAYSLDADKSGWDPNQVLRPPGTIHQESGKVVRVLESNSTTHDLGSFRHLASVPEVSKVSLTADLPGLDFIKKKYKEAWTGKAKSCFEKPVQPVGKRSSAMTAMAFYCVEMGMSDSEAFVVLLDCDNRWKKYINREPADREKRIVGILTHCRSEKAGQVQLGLEDSNQLILLEDFLNMELKFNWIYEGLLPEQGYGMIASQPGVGKSTISIGLGMCVILGKDFMIWKNVAKIQHRVAFYSLEMPHQECEKFIRDMLPGYTDEEQTKIKQNFLLLPKGSSLSLYEHKKQKELEEEVIKYNITFLIIDSLMASTTLDEKRVADFNDWVHKKLRAELGVTVWVVHHNRKPVGDSRDPKGLEDLYGDTFISSHPTTILMLSTSDKLIRVLCAKIRLAATPEPFYIERGPNLSFKHIAGAEVKKTVNPVTGIAKEYVRHGQSKNTPF